MNSVVHLAVLDVLADLLDCLAELMVVMVVELQIDLLKCAVQQERRWIGTLEHCPCMESLVSKWCALVYNGRSRRKDISKNLCGFTVPIPVVCCFARNCSSLLVNRLHISDTSLVVTVESIFCNSEAASS